MKQGVRVWIRLNWARICPEACSFEHRNDSSVILTLEISRLVERLTLFKEGSATCSY